jgi:hypothetical protein
MGKGKGSARRARWLGAFAVGLMLALSVPSMAFAVNTASFKSPVPVTNSHSTNAQPTISLIGYDRYGIRASGVSMYVSGVRVYPTFTYNNLGNRSFRLSYAVPAPLSLGAHRVTVKTRDLRNLTSSTSWLFYVDENVPPVTTSNAVASYTTKATILLFAMDNAGGSGVDHTSYTLDGVAGNGNFAFTAVVGAHTLTFWSVDRAGNVEAAHTVNFLVGVDLFAHAAPVNACTAAGCHGGKDVATIHWAEKCTPCHATGVTPTTDCTVCHGANGPANHLVHATIASTSTPACTQAGCHGTDIAVIHGTCARCHDSSDPDVIAAIAAGGATCETCHAGIFAATHVAPVNTAHAVSGSCFTPLCHNATDVGAIHTNGDDPPGCQVCHVNNGPATTAACGTCHPNLQAFHDFTHVNASGTKSSACTSCHGTDIPTVHAAVGCICHTASFLRAEMTPLLAAHTAECVDCHKGQYAGHGFATTPANPAVSGHNTTTYGKVGAYTKFDGSEGVVVKDSANATITQTWPLPTADVFWSQSNLGSLSVTDSPAVAMGALSSAIRTDVGWGSVITCQDCHTNLSAALGPQGANAGQVGLDPRFPDDWTKAEITTFDPTGMRSILTTAGSTNPYYTKSLSATASTGYSSGDVPIRMICQKCHKLTNYHQGEPAQSRAGRSKLDMGLSNEAHMEHHGDQILGQANCVGCHAAIPHGWKRPRLLVYSTDPAPYVASQPTTATGGNWTYGPSVAGTSTHLDALNASPEWEKEATSGPVAGGWDQSVYGIEWGAPGTEAVQTNCNACSATGATHTPASEGVPVGEPTWK